jgi:hypothetical protein
MFSELISDRIWRKQIHNPAEYRHVEKLKWLVLLSDQWQHRISILVTCPPTYTPFRFLSWLIIIN